VNGARSSAARCERPRHYHSIQRFDRSKSSESPFRKVDAANKIRVAVQRHERTTLGKNFLSASRNCAEKRALSKNFFCRLATTAREIRQMERYISATVRLTTPLLTMLSDSVNLDQTVQGQKSTSPRNLRRRRCTRTVTQSATNTLVSESTSSQADVSNPAAKFAARARTSSLLTNSCSSTCPRCVASLRGEFKDGGPGRFRYLVICGACPWSAGPARIRDAAVKLWNEAKPLATVNSRRQDSTGAIHPDGRSAIAPPSRPPRR
jgi:hypothetical protein